MMRAFYIPAILRIEIFHIRKPPIRGGGGGASCCCWCGGGGGGGGEPLSLALHKYLAIKKSKIDNKIKIKVKIKK